MIMKMNNAFPGQYRNIQVMMIVVMREFIPLQANQVCAGMCSTVKIAHSNIPGKFILCPAYIPIGVIRENQSGRIVYLASSQQLDNKKTGNNFTIHLLCDTGICVFQ